MSTEENKTLARRFYAALNTALDGRDPAALTEQDLAVFDEILAPEQARRTKQEGLSWFYSHFGDHRIEITDMIAEGDTVWARVATSGGHTGEWKGIAPTGRRWTNTGVMFFRIADGRVAEWAGQFDQLNLLMQLGAIITPPAAEHS
jgi:predicted ester cyclase